MANRYIGMRYVPKFYGEWDAESEYEPLSVVVYTDGNGYTSKKDVPKGVAPNEDNGEYWAYTYRAGGSVTSVPWDAITGVPATFPTTWESITGKPESYPVKWADISDKPTQFTPSAHKHGTSDIQGLDTTLSTLQTGLSKTANKTLDNVANSDFLTKAKAAGVIPEKGSVTWDAIEGKPSSFPTTWNDISGKPSTFPPATHSHAQGDITGLTDAIGGLQQSISAFPQNYANITLSNVDNAVFKQKAEAAGVGGGGGGSGSVTWDNIQGKPETFTPSTHTHPTSEITDFSTSVESAIKSSSVNTNLTALQQQVTAMQAGIEAAVSDASKALTKAKDAETDASQALSIAQSVDYNYITSETNGTITSGVTYRGRKWSNGYKELWIKCNVNNLPCTTALGNWFRSNSVFGTLNLPSGYTFSNEPYINMTYTTTANLGGIVWPNMDTSQHIRQRVCPFYIIRPTNGAVTGYVTIYMYGN